MIRGDPLHHIGRRHTTGQRVQRGHQLLAAARHDHRPVAEHGPAPGQHRADRRRVELRTLRHVRAQSRGLVPQRLRIVRRQQPRHRRPLRCGVTRRIGGGRLQDDVRVRAADPERGHGGPARTVALCPVPVLGEQAYGSRLPVDMRGRLVHVQGAGQYPVAHGLHHLDDAADAGGGLGVPDVGLQRAQPQRLFVRPVLPVRGEERLRLDRVAQPRARAVRLDRVHVTGGQPGVLQRLADHPLLRRAVRRGQLPARTVLVDGGAPDDGEDAVAVAAGVRQPLHEEQTHALAPARAVRRRRERLAPAVRGQPALPAELDEETRGRDDRRPARQRQVALAPAQGLHREMQRHQRRRARRVDRHRRALQPEGVRQPPGSHGPGAAGADVPLQAVRGAADAPAVVPVHHPGEHPGTGAAQRVGVDARPFERLPGGLQEQPLLGVDGDRLARADPEERRVEPVRLVQEAALPGVAAAGPFRVGVVERGRVPPPVLREGGDRVGAGGDDVPQLLGGAHATRVAAGHAHDRDRFVPLGLGLGQPLPGLEQVTGHALEVVAEPGLVRHATSTLLVVRVIRSRAVRR